MTTNPGESLLSRASVTISVDTDRCIGGGECVLAEPGVFTFGEDHAATINTGPELRRLSTERLSEIIANCPGSALSAHETPNGEAK